MSIGGLTAFTLLAGYGIYHFITWDYSLSSLSDFVGGVILSIFGSMKLEPVYNKKLSKLSPESDYYLFGRAAEERLISKLSYPSSELVTFL